MLDVCYRRAAFTAKIKQMQRETDAERQDRESKSIMGEGSLTPTYTHIHRVPLIMSVRPGREILNHGVGY